MRSRLLQLLNQRELEKMKEFWLKKRIKCSKVEDLQDGIPVTNIGGVFVVILVGIIMAIVTLICEYSWYKYHHRRISGVVSHITDNSKNSNIVESAQQGPSTIFHNRSINEARPRSRSTTKIQITD